MPGSLLFETTRYSDDVKQQIESGGDSIDINVGLRLTVLKPLHAVWLVDLYNHQSSPTGVRHIAKGWEKAGISGLLDDLRWTNESSSRRPVH